MKILHVNDYALDTGWGAEIHIARLIDGLRAAGDEVHTFFASGPRSGLARALDLWDPSARRRLRALVASLRPDVVHVHNFQRELSASVLGVAPGAAWVLTAHDHRLFGAPDADDVRPGRAVQRATKAAKARFELALARKHVHAVIAPSEDLVRRIRGAGFADAHLIRYFADAGDEPATTPSQSEDVVFVGRVSADKGVLTLLSAFERVAHGRPAARLLIAGEGEERERIAGRLPALATRIETLGRLDPAAVRALMGRARLVCIPSIKREGAPIVSIEAALSGRPVVVSDDPGLTEMVEEAAFGIVTPRGDAAALAAGLDALLADPARADALGRRGRVHALGAWTTQSQIPKFRALYRALIDRVGGSNEERTGRREG